MAAEKNTIHFITIAQIETPIIPDPSPITAVTGTTTTKIVSKHGDSTKPISVYANRDAENPVKSSAAGIKINISSFTLNLSLGFDNIGLYSSITDGNTTDSFHNKTAAFAMPDNSVHFMFLLLPYQEFGKPPPDVAK